LIWLFQVPKQLPAVEQQLEQQQWQLFEQLLPRENQAARPKLAHWKDQEVVSRFPAFHFQVNQLKKERKMPCTWSKFVFLWGRLNVCFVRSRLVEKKKRNSVLFTVVEERNQIRKKRWKRHFLPTWVAIGFAALPWLDWIWKFYLSGFSQERNLHPSLVSKY
jgi:hypothetical protein